MPARQVHVLPSPLVLTEWLDRIRDELEVPASFPEPVEAEAAVSAREGPVMPWLAGREADVPDRRDLPFVAIDPPGARDLDQAFHAERRSTGYRVHYAIADVAAFVAPGGAVDVEAHERGVTRYQPDRRTPLYPECIGQGAASLLPDQDRQASLWTIDLDADGGVVGAPTVARAHIRNRRALTYADVQAALDHNTAPEPLQLLREIGRLRQALEAERGGVSLRIPAQEVVVEGGHAQLRYETTLPVEEWNAQISLLTGIVAADLMLDAGVGLLRTVEPPDDQSLQRLRRSARALGIDWPGSLPYPAFVRTLDPTTRAGAALLTQAARTTGGAGYTAFDGAPPANRQHGAIADEYAHVTAPLRRLADRFTNEVLLATCADREPPPWAREALASLPETMAAAQRRERTLERAVVDLAEALVLEDRVGDELDAVIVSVDAKDRQIVQLSEPAIVATITPDKTRNGDRSDASEPRRDPRAHLGHAVRVRVMAADPKRRVIELAIVGRGDTP